MLVPGVAGRGTREGVGLSGCDDALRSQDVLGVVADDQKIRFGVVALEARVTYAVLLDCAHAGAETAAASGPTSGETTLGATARSFERFRTAAEDGHRLTHAFAVYGEADDSHVLGGAIGPCRDADFGLAEDERPRLLVADPPTAENAGRQTAENHAAVPDGVTRLVVERVSPVDGVDDLDPPVGQVLQTQCVDAFWCPSHEDLAVGLSAVERLFDPLYQDGDLDVATWAPDGGSDEHYSSWSAGEVKLTSDIAQVPMTAQKSKLNYIIFNYLFQYSVAGDY